MRVLLLCNNWVGWQVTRWLREQNEDIAGLVVHPAQQQKYGAEILESAALPPERVFSADRIREASTREAIGALNADLAVSAFFGDILRPRFLQMFPQGVINLHPALLPYNRGSYPNVWSIVDKTPAGATLHYIDPGIDTGDIISQQEIPIAPSDTGATLYQKLEIACFDLFRVAWPLIKTGCAPRRPQPPGAGTYHRSADVTQIDEIDLDRHYEARELINILRARTFPPHLGAFYWHGARKIFLRLQLEEETGHDSDN